MNDNTKKSERASGRPARGGKRLAARRPGAARAACEEPVPLRQTAAAVSAKPLILEWEEHAPPPGDPPPAGVGRKLRGA